MRRSHRARSPLVVLVVLLAGGTLLSSLAGCRLLSREVACRRDRDCPKDAGMNYCTAVDDDAGVCTDDEDARGEGRPPDAGTTSDGGALDAGGAPDGG